MDKICKQRKKKKKNSVRNSKLALLMHNMIAFIFLALFKKKETKETATVKQIIVSVQIHHIYEGCSHSLAGGQGVFSILPFLL